MLGENTNTPGITGEERRNVLMKRLIEAICGQEDESELNTILSVSNKDDLSKVVQIQSLPSIQQVIQPPTITPSLDIDQLAMNSVNITNDNDDVLIDNADRVTLSEISSLKKELKRILNQRAIYIASKLSGTNQDNELKHNELQLVKVDHEISLLKQALQVIYYSCRYNVVDIL